MKYEQLLELKNKLSVDYPDENLQKNHEEFKKKLISLFDFDCELYNSLNNNDESTKDLFECELQIYNEYINKVSNLIDKYEVVAHDLPEEYMEMIRDLQNQLIEAHDKRIIGFENKKNEIIKAQKILYVLYYTIKLDIIKEYINSLKKYKKRFAYLDYNSYEIEGVPCLKILKSKVNGFKIRYKSCLSYKTKFFVETKYGVCYCFNEIVKDDKENYIESLFNECELLLEQIEGKYVKDEKNNDVYEPGIYVKALSNGGGMPLGVKIFKIFFNYILPAILTFAALILWIKKL